MSRPTTPTPPLPTITTTSASDNNPFTSPARSSTHPQKPSQQKTHHHHHPHHSHHQHRYNKSVPQSALERSTPNPFGDFFRGERRRRGSIDDPNISNPASAPPKLVEEPSDLDASSEHNRRSRVRLEAAEKERQQNVRNEVEKLRARRKDHEGSLRQTLSHLSDLGTTMTRRLDYTYYALLTSLSSLTSGVKSFHALAKESRGMCEGFVAETETLEKETGQSMKGTIETLEKRAERVGELQKRMRGAKGRMEELGRRLDVVKGKVEEAGRKDGEGRARVGRRWKVCSWCVGTWVLLLAVAAMVRRVGNMPPLDVEVLGRNGNESMDTAGLNATEKLKVGDANLPVMVAGAVESACASVSCGPSAGRQPESTGDGDAARTLKLFDNL